MDKDIQDKLNELKKMRDITQSKAIRKMINYFYKNKKLFMEIG